MRIPVPFTNLRGAGFAIVANALALVAAPLLQFAFLPLFRVTLGNEGIALYGILVSSWALISAAEALFGPGLQRELAQTDVTATAVGASFARAIERAAWVCTLVVIVVVAGFVLALPSEAHATIGAHGVAVPIAVFVSAVALRLPPLLYAVLFAGLRRPLQLAGWRAGGEVLRVGGAAWLVLATEATISTFVAWQAVALLVQSLMGALLLRLASDRRATSPVATPSIGSFDALRICAERGGRVAVVLLLGLVVANVDRFALALAGAWQALGHYTLASMLAGVQVLLGVAATTVIAPRLSASRVALQHGEVGETDGPHTILDITCRAALLMGIGCGAYAAGASVIVDQFLSWFHQAPERKAVEPLILLLWGFAANTVASFGFQLCIAARVERRVWDWIFHASLPYVAAVAVGALLHDASAVAAAFVLLNAWWLYCVTTMRAQSSPASVVTIVRAGAIHAMCGVLLGGVTGAAASVAMRYAGWTLVGAMDFFKWIIALGAAASAIAFVALRWGIRTGPPLQSVT